MSNAVAIQRYLDMAVENPERIRPVGGQFVHIVLDSGRRVALPVKRIEAHAKKKRVDSPVTAPKKRNRRGSPGH